MDLKEQVISCVSQFKEANFIPLMDKSKTIEASLAFILGSNLTIPSEPCTDVAIWYKRHSESQQVILSEANEIYIVDIDRVMDMAFTVWKARYDLVHSQSALANFVLGTKTILPTTWFEHLEGSSLEWVMYRIRGCYGY